MTTAEVIQLPIPGGHIPVSHQLLRHLRPGLYRVRGFLEGANGGRRRWRDAGKVRVRGGKISLSATSQRALIFTRPELVLRALEFAKDSTALRFLETATKRRVKRALGRDRAERRRKVRILEAERWARGGAPSPAAVQAATTEVSQPRGTRVREAWRRRGPGAKGAVLGLLAMAAALGGGTYAPVKRRGR